MMNQFISNVLMQPRPDAGERLTLIEKLELEKECWHDDGENNVHRVIDDCIDIVKQHSEWISVDERLPNEDGEYLVYVDATKFKGGKFIDMEFFKTSINEFCYFMGEAEVTHWQPLPQPPSEV